MAPLSALCGGQQPHVQPRGACKLRSARQFTCSYRRRGGKGPGGLAGACQVGLVPRAAEVRGPARRAATIPSLMSSGGQICAVFAAASTERQPSHRFPLACLARALLGVCSLLFTYQTCGIFLPCPLRRSRRGGGASAGAATGCRGGRWQRHALHHCRIALHRCPASSSGRPWSRCRGAASIAAAGRGRGRGRQQALAAR